MASPHESTHASWPGFDRSAEERLLEHALSDEGRAFRKRLGDDFHISRGRGIVLGPPKFVAPEKAHELRRYVRAYHRCLERIVEASRTDPAILSVLSLPPSMVRDLERDVDPLGDRVHLFRLDLLLTEDGGFRVLENNANCPGGILYTGIAARGWRDFLSSRGEELPEPLPHEAPEWMARWFLDSAERDGAGRPDFVALLRWEGGNDIELREFAEAFGMLGVDSEQIDPRELEEPGDGGPPTLRGRPVGHAYMKLGLQPFLAARDEVDVMVDAIRERRLFVQNGLRGRWVADSKLALVLLSDPDFAHLFDPDDLAVVAPGVPWSRNGARLDDELVDEVLSERERFVLKRALDTRGRGVIVGREIESDEAWRAAVDTARDEGWLVQEFCDTTRTRADFDTPLLFRHDLAVAVVEGEVGAFFMRSSGEYKVNVAQNGRLHPVFRAGAAG